ncbi:MAG: LysR family transcriptional regulator [Clostridia bacterium]|nr:LysR family transcriptional regulator [Clostridia bacterium]
MSTEELKTFIFLSKVKNFTLAAEHLSIAQSTVTNRISELEKEVGKRLFNRDSKSVRLTPEGKIFLKYAERIIELQETSVEEMNALSAYRHKISIGAINATYETYVKPVLDECLKTSNDTTVRVTIGHSLDLIRQLQDNVLDLVFSAIPLKRIGYVCKVYDTDKMVLVTGKGANAYKRGITEEDLVNIPYLMCNFSLSQVGSYIRALFPENHVFKMEVDNSSKLLPYLKNGSGYSFLPYKLIRKELEEGLLEEVKLLNFSAPKAITYLIHKQDYDPSVFLKYKPEEV